MEHLAAISLLALGLSTGAAMAQDTPDPDEFCRKAGRNQAIFELLPKAATAQSGKAAGDVNCSWAFEGRVAISVALQSRLMHSPLAARQEILMARLPENRRGKTIEPLPKMGDDGLSRATVVDGKTTQYEIEAVKGRRHFLMTVRPSTEGDLDYRIQAASVSFLGVGISALYR